MSKAEEIPYVRSFSDAEMLNRAVTAAAIAQAYAALSPLNINTTKYYREEAAKWIKLATDIYEKVVD